MNILFLDYDGVVNTIMWGPNGERANYGFPDQNKVNDEQAVQWVSEFCEKFNYRIVVTSTWRLHNNWAMCLANAGLRKTVKIYDRLPLDRDKSRAQLIKEYLSDHKNIEHFIILDDEEVNGDIEGSSSRLEDYLILCPASTGFKCDEYLKAKALHEDLQKRNIKV